MANNFKKIIFTKIRKVELDLDVPLVKIPVVNLGLLKSLSTKKDELLSSHTSTQYIITYIL